MKICIVNSSYDGVNSPFEKYDPLPDPGRYIPASRHKFVTRWVTKANAKAEIDEICKEKFDMYMNYMWGTEMDNVAGVEATRYLESKGVPVLANPSSFLAKTKLDLHKAAEKTGLLMPRDTPGRYPKIVKYADSCGSLNLDYDSICHDDESVKKRVAHLQKENDIFGIMVSDYIIGSECSVIVVEMGSEVVALTPLECVFPVDTPPEHEFLTWHNKFEACHDGSMSYRFVEGTRKVSLQKAAIDAFKAIGAGGGGAWARADLRWERATGDAYVLEINPIPVVFYPVGNKLGDDIVVGETFPGAQPAFFDVLLATKMIQLGWNKEHAKCVASVYDGFSERYDAAWEVSGLRQVQKFMAANFDFTGTVLDVACGTGAVGRVLHEAGVEADITGIEISEGMIQSTDIQRFYQMPIRVGLMEEEVMRAGEFDHIACFSALHFLDPIFFHAVLARMFMLARKSVSFEVNDLPDDYITWCLKNISEQFWNVNHVQTMEEFGVPKGWKLVHKSREFLFTSPHSGHDVYGYAMRFERL